MTLRIPTVSPTPATPPNSIVSLPGPLYPGAQLKADRYDVLAGDLLNNPTGRTPGQRLLRPSVPADAVAAARMALREREVPVQIDQGTGQHSWEISLTGADKIALYLDDVRIHARWIAGDFTDTPGVTTDMARFLTASARFFTGLGEATIRACAQREIFPLSEFLRNAVRGPSNSVAELLPESTQGDSLAAIFYSRNNFTDLVSRDLAEALLRDDIGLKAYQRAVAGSAPQTRTEILRAFLSNLAHEPALGEVSLEHFFNAPAGVNHLRDTTLRVVLSVRPPAVR